MTSSGVVTPAIGAWKIGARRFNRFASSVVSIGSTQMVNRDRPLFGCINGVCPYFGLEQEASEHAAGGEEPQRVELVDEKHRGGAGGGDQPQAPIGAAA